MFADLPAGIVSQFELRLQGARLADSVLSVPEGPGVHTVSTRVLEASVPMRGSLADMTGTPLPRIRVVEGMGAVLGSAMSDDNGTFALLTAPSQNRHWLRLDSDDYVLHSDHGSRGAEIRHTDHYCAKPDQLDHIALVADRAARLVGRVLDSDGTPVHDAAVQLLALYGEKPEPPGTQKLYVKFAATRSRRDGSFDLARLDAHFPADLWLSVASPRGCYSHLAVPLLPGKRSDLGSIRLPAPAVIEGTVRGRDGRPRPGALVTLHLAGECAVADPNLGTWFGRTDRLGRFRFLGLPAGDYVLQNEDEQLVDPDLVELARVHASAGERKDATKRPR